METDEIMPEEQTTGIILSMFIETHTSSNDTYLIIRGRYNGESFFYKMALVDDNRNMLNIQRNTEYIFTITSIRGRGFSSIADVKASLASNTNLDYTILVQEKSVYEIVSNNEYYLGVTNSHFEIYASAGTTSEYTRMSLLL